MSPYLFLLCVEGLSSSLTNGDASGIISGCKISQQAHAVTHLFADDSFLFFKATKEKKNVIKSLLDSYEQLSGQAINYQKSGIFFSANVRRDKQNELSDILGVKNDLSKGNYLGLSSLIGKSKKIVFTFLKDRVGKRIQSLSSNLLSKTGKSVLIKSVVQAIPSYCMTCFLIPKTLCTELENMMNAYW